MNPTTYGGQKMTDHEEALPTIGIQYKGTDTCLDFTCPCGTYTHYCRRMPFCGAVLCKGCDQTWVLSHRITVNPPGPDDDWRVAAAARDAEDDDD